MSKKPKSLNSRKLHDVVVNECTQFYKYGRRARASDVAIIIKTDHPDLYLEFSDQLADRQLRRMCAQAMKSWQAVAGKDAAQQLGLPGFERHMADRLPPAISIPVAGDKQDIEFVPSAIALISEWKQHLEYLRDQHKSIGAVIDAILELIERGAGCPPDVPLVQFVASKSVEAIPA
jgi:hypothetical protein